MYEMQNANKDLKEPIEFFGPPGRWDSNSNRWRQENLIDPFEVFDSSKQKVAALPNLQPYRKQDLKSEKLTPPLFLNTKTAVIENNANTLGNTLSVQSIAEIPSSQKRTGHELLKTFKSSERVTAYEINNKLLKMESILTLNEKIYRYNGNYYEECGKDEIARLFLIHCREEVAEMGSSKQVYDAINFISMEPKIHITSEMIPENLLSLRNGILNIHTGVMFKHSKDFKTLYGINGNYISNAYLHCPIFDGFLQTVTGGDMLLIQRIYEFIGYSISPDTNAKVFFALQGVPNSGKSVLVTFLSKLFSKNAVVTLDAHVFSDKYSISELVGKALCISPDLPAAPLDEKAVSKIKQITGNDVVSSNRKYESYVSFRCNAKIVLVTNHPILTRANDCAFEERIVTIPFQHSVSKEKQNSNLITNLLMESDAIITKSLQAYFELVKNHYQFTGNYPINDVVANDYESVADISVKIYNFVKQMFKKSDEDIIFTEDAYKKYCTFNAGISLNEFSLYFKRFTEEIHGGRKERKRKKGESNAKSCISGIKWNCAVDSF